MVACILTFRGKSPDDAIKVIQDILGIEEDEAAKVNGKGLILDGDNANFILSQFGASDDGSDNLWTLKRAEICNA